MWTGRQTLASIESAITNLRQEESQLDAALRSAGDEAARLRKERGEALRELARIKLDEMAAGRLVGGLDAGERRAMQILEDSRLRLAALSEQREALLEEVASAEAERSAAAAALEAALAALEAVRTTATANVQRVPDWQAAKQAVRQCRGRCIRGGEKSGQLGSRVGRQAQALRRRPAVHLPLAAQVRDGRLSRRQLRSHDGPHRRRLHRLRRRAPQLRGADRDPAAAEGACHRQAGRSHPASQSSIGHRAARHDRGRHRSTGAGAQRGPSQARRRRPDTRGQEWPVAQARGRAQGPGRHRHQPVLHSSAGNDRVGRQQG